MECVIVVTHLNIQPGDHIELKGQVAPDAKSFAVNLGRSGLDLALYFNPRFESQGDAWTIVCNSLQKGEWGEEQREPRFPFQQGQEGKMTFSFDAQEMCVTLQEHLELTFPNRLGLETISFLSVEGDFKVTSLKFK
ncbi:16 kDa beta-galactoside-binding lectin-like isoform X2 [Alligator sinensis]|uniref:Galectin n=1 Tax=Alligator sinensis TaxID=38654 RepID=A0A1U7SX40_ALLSI|nr:16 kDa beta-galactoside-binding lectin-like isoform X2 [Alligator sinensis]